MDVYLVVWTVEALVETLVDVTAVAMAFDVESLMAGMSGTQTDIERAAWKVV